MVEHEIHSEWRRDVAVDESVEKQAGANLCLRGDCHYLEHGDERRLIVQAAWTRRSRSEAAKRPNRESWKQRTDTHMRPFLLNVFFYRKFIHAKVMHRPTRKVISVATTNARNIRINIPQAHS
ncbi:hypothetical protein Bca52824_065355 [Brassica carinata]|uniref:Uncharacterized protein n=1 Tax=Brassica carinata TaxID=52824 RepID=A0A8X7QIA9_BRACI|nr:hypothetical protein Bca52824_065355 [Brassica carinata]